MSLHQHLRDAEDRRAGYRDAARVYASKAVSGSVAGAAAMASAAGGEQPFGGSGPGPCNYAGAGLFRIAPIMVSTEQTTLYVFDFADEPLCPPAERSPGNTTSERMPA